MQPAITYQVSHKHQVCYGQESRQHVQPHAAQRAHVDYDEVYVDGTHDQDHHSASYLKYPAER